jgi:la-related protein 1
MTSPVSYANVAKGQFPEQELHEVSGEASRSETSGVEVTSTEEPQEAEAATAEPAEPTESTQSAEAAETKEKEAAAKEKKPLAPAPVPSKSAWGAAANVSNKPVDEHKWPTPDKASLSDQQATATQKFIKPITNKWVPINAKVILPSGRANSQKQKQNKKNKKGANTQKKQVNNQSTQNTQNNNPNMQANQPVAGISKTDGQFESPEQAQQPHDGFKPRPNGQFQGQAQGQAQQKNMRRFNGNTNGSFKPRFPNQPPSQQQQQPSPQQNGFYHPQPFVQNQNYQNFNNRQFRPNQFRHQNNRNSFHQPMNGSNGFINSSMGLPQQIPQQIPPPISPKQDPQQALTQQIDYYFSLENLIKDIFLRKNMNTEGWVSLALILNFKRVKIIINGIQNSIENKEISSSTIILDSLKHCENLEINYLNGKDLQTADIDDIELRVKGNYEQWLLPNDN